MPAPGSQDAFRNTRWSMVAELQQPTHARARLDELCIRYWAPVQACIAARGYDVETATRLTRGFFDHLVREGIARAADHGRFRLFLLAELERYLAMSDQSVATAPPDEHALRHGFALEVIAHAMQRLHDEAAHAGRLAMFERLQPYLSSEGSADEYARDADALAVHPLMIAMSVRRMRQRFRQLVDEELVQLTRSSDEFEAERQALRDALEHTS